MSTGAMFALGDEAGGLRKALLGVGVCVCAVVLVLASSLISIFLVYSIRTGNSHNLTVKSHDIRTQCMKTII
jgi:hypothetical protein